MIRQRPVLRFGPVRGCRSGRRWAFACWSAALLPVACTRPAAPLSPPSPRSATLTLDAAAPFIDASIAGVPVRLRVTPAAQGPIDLAPAVAARLDLRWEAAEPIDVGRVRLSGRAARATLVVAGVAVPVTVADHGRAASPGGDGEVAPGVLPYATVVWRRPDAPPPTLVRTLPLDRDAELGWSAATEVPGVAVRFDPAQPVTSATAAAGARLARAWGGGRWVGGFATATAAFGVARTVRRLAFARPGTLAGWPIAELPVRVADFAGRDALPTDPPRPDEVVVSRRVVPQRGWPAVTLGADRLDRCREVAFTATPPTLTLRCAP